MSEAELHVLMARLRGGIVNKVRRGEFRCVLPTGLVYNQAGDVILDPDSQVRETIAHFFETFSRVGSAHQTVKAFRDQQLSFPSRIRILGGGTQIVFRPLTAWTAMRTLTNPRYSGTYAYGRRHYRRTVDGRLSHEKRHYSQWLACIPNSHPGYISWEQYLENLTVLQSNGRGYELARKSPPREGAALLQGRAVCGRCGRHFRVRYRSCRGKNESWYVCDRANTTNAAPNCQSISGRAVDEAVGILVAEKMTPQAVELVMQIRKEIETRQQEAVQLRSRAIERAQLEAELAQRRFMMVDPANRLVADTLEADWNDKLREVDKAKQQMQRHRSEAQDAVVNDALRDRLVAMSTDFKKLWSDPNTSNREKKRMLAHIIEDVTLLKLPGQKLTKLHVRFKGGKTETLTTANPRSSAQQIQTPAQIVKLVDRLLDDYVYYQIADILNERGFRPGGTARAGCENRLFDAKRVAWIVHAYGLQMRYDRLRQRGMLTPKEMAARLGIHEQTLAQWAKHGIVKRHAYNERWYLYESPAQNPPTKQCSRWNRLVDRGTFVQTKNK
jgi:hypothetical protein